MALAILELREFDKANVLFNIDTGTNRYYQLKIGRSVQRRYGIDWIDDEVFSTSVLTNAAGGDLFNSSKDISIPLTHFDKSNAYAQLFSFKTPQGKSPALSRIVKVPIGFGVPAAIPSNLALPFSVSSSMKTIDLSFQPPRRIPCRTPAQVYARQASLEDLLAGIVKLAGPIVLKLLDGPQNQAQQSSPSGSAGSNGGAGQADILSLLLKTVLGKVAGPAVSQGQSMIGPAIRNNRFFDRANSRFSQPFIFGIDDAILGTLIGPVLQVLPQLMNAANQKRVQLKQADNKLISEILSDVNRRLLLQQLLEAQRRAPADGQPANSADMDQLLQLLQQAPAAPQQVEAGTAPPQAPAAAVSTVKSLSLDASSTLSNKAVVSFVTADPVAWDGMQKVLFAKNQGLQLKVQLNVAEPVPKTPLPKAILKIVFKYGPDQSVNYEKTFKQKGVLPNSVMALPFSQDELSKLPVNKTIAVLAEMRWLSSNTGREHRALGSSEIILVNNYFLKEQGKDVSTERELTDMKQFRAFWNKIWEAPVLDVASGKGDSEKHRWELDVNAKYSILLSTDHESNGLMETKLLQGKADEESLAAKTEGRMKAGIELSIAELNKLLPLWDGQAALDRDKLEAFNSDTFAKKNASEFIYNFKLKGRAGERGIIWVVPIFKLFEFTLNSIQTTDDAGQVATVAEEKIRFPLPVSARVIGLKSQ
jgi:hypothetical protein